MTGTETARTIAFRVIQGQHAPTRPRPHISRADAPRLTWALPAHSLPAPDLTAPELAAEMALIFAMSLVRKHSLADLQDPHCAIRIDPATRFTLHELLCELRSLSWFDPGSLPQPRPQAARRRALHWTAEGQLTLGTLFRCGVAQTGAAARLSALWRCDHAVAVPAPLRRPPSANAPMSAWLDWCARQSGAGLQTPGGQSAHPRIGSLEDMCEDLHHIPPTRPFHNAVLSALAHGDAPQGTAPHGDGLPGPRWRGPRLLAMMAEAEARASRAVLAQARASDRLTRPGVTAARMTVWLAREERSNGSVDDLHRAAANELAEAAPNLLHWVSRANAGLRGGRQHYETTLFLPLAEASRQACTPSDCATHVAVAGAMATLIKAVFGGSGRAQLQMVGSSAPALILGEEADRMAANMALARVVSGGYHPAENMHDLRLGQAIALQVLREAVEDENRSASLQITDFDGRQLRMDVHPRSFGRGLAELRADGHPVPWPQEAAPPAAHLTAVV